MSDSLDRRVDAVFSASSAILLLLTAWVVAREIQPPYRADQDRAYAELASAAEEAGDAEMASYWAEAAPRGIIQIFLSTGEVERCLTCHVDDASLESWHKENVNDTLPPSVYGCTACHGGEALGLAKGRAHRHMMATRAEMEEHLYSDHDSNAEIASAFWARLQEISPPLSNPVAERVSDFRDVHVTGDPAAYLGSALCLSCHSPEVAIWEHTYSERTWWHVDRWRDTKFRSFEVMSAEPDYVDPPSSSLEEMGWTADDYRANCKGCHTTGYRYEKDRDGNVLVDSYNEAGVTCEGCHGPGQIFGGLMLRGIAETTEGLHNYQGEGALIARIHTDRNVCISCHHPNRHMARPTDGDRGELARLDSRRYDVMGHLEPLPPLTDRPDPTPAPAPTPPGDDDPLVARGRELHVSMGCVACHTLDGSALVAPSWKDLYGSERVFTDGTTAVADDGYLEKSIRDPGLDVVEGYFNVMPATFADMSAADLEALIALIKAVSGAGPAPSSPPAEDGLVSQGRDLATSLGCIACHSIDGTPMVGPTWQGVFGTERALDDGTTVVADEAYMEESIRDPNAKVVEGFYPSMLPTYSGLSAEEMAALIAYLKTL